MARAARGSGRHQGRIGAVDELVCASRLGAVLSRLALGAVAAAMAACDAGSADGVNSTPTGGNVDSTTGGALGSSLSAPPHAIGATSDEPRSETGATIDSSPASSESSEAAPTGTDPLGASSSAPSTADSCVEVITLPEGSTGRIELPFAVYSGETLLEPGTEVAVEGAESYAVTLLGLFLTAPRLEAEDGSLVDAVLLDAADRPLPYGVFFYHSESPLTSMRLAAPPGNYRALQLHLGAPDECLGSTHHTPLNPDSEMYWSWGATFLALRLEGRSRSSDAGALGFSFHLGPLPTTPLVMSNIRVEGELPVETAAVGPELRLDVNKVLFPHPAGEALTGHLPFADWLVTNTVASAFELKP